MKKQLPGRVFADDDETKAAVMKVLERFSTDLFIEGLEALAKCSQNCVSVNGDFGDKQTFFYSIHRYHIYSSWSGYGLFERPS